MADHDFQSAIDAIASMEAIPVFLKVICRVTGMGFSAVARVTEDRWVCLAVHDEISFGLKPGGELEVESTLCHEVRQASAPIVIEHVAKSEAYCNHHTPARYGFQSYISIPIYLKDGSFYGTLCAIDPRPAVLNADVIEMFETFAALIAFHIDATERFSVSEARLASSEESLLDARTSAELREQFIAVLGHDLRNPLASVLAAGQLLRKTPLSDKALGIIDLMERSARRMSGLIDNIMDFARGRLGGGIAVTIAAKSLEPVLQQVIDELKSAYPERAVEAEFLLHAPVACDRLRIGQLFSNLLGNALIYGTSDKPVRVRAETDAASFRLVVCNAGDPVPPAAMERLFHPFSRGVVRRSQQGLGLGLYIASEIAKAHHGTLAANSTPTETCFTFTMPLEQPRGGHAVT